MVIDNEHLEQDGRVERISGSIRFAVLSSGEFLRIGHRLFVTPGSPLTLALENQRFILNLDSDRLQEASGCDKDAWSNMADATRNSTMESNDATPSRPPPI